MQAALLQQVIQRLSWNPGPLEHPSIERHKPAPLLAPGQPFTLLCWNIQYAASTRHHFFYDGGRAARVPISDVYETLRSIQRLLQRLSPDILLLQELDRGSARTGAVDQLHALTRGCSPANVVSAPYHRVPFLPVPLHDMLGRVEMHVAILSRFRLEQAERHSLPLLNEPAWRQAFNLKRCILSASLPLEGGGRLRLGCTHLSAFSRGDGTMARQVEQVTRWLQEGPALIGGDLNLLPVGDDPKRLEGDSVLYSDAQNPLEPLARAYGSVPPQTSWLEPEWRTYLPYGSAVPDRVLDYCFFTPQVEVLEAEVVKTAPELSDHLPLRVRLRVRR